jgi:hypothetical protein
LALIFAGRVDWQGLFLSDPAYARSAYIRVNQKSLDPEYAPTLDIYFKQKNINGALPEATVTPPVVTNPTTTDADYQSKVVADQIEAARLEALATYNAAKTKREAAEAAAELERLNQVAQTVTQNTPASTPAPTPTENTPTETTTTEKPKSSPIPLLVAVGLAYLVLKG